MWARLMADRRLAMMPARLKASIRSSRQPWFSIMHSYCRITGDTVRRAWSPRCADMADDSFLDFVLEQLADAKPLKVRPMFGVNGRAAQLRAPVQDSTGGPAGVAGTRSRVGGAATQYLGFDRYG